MPSRILLTQLRRIGDVLMTTPAVAALRAAYPEARISYLTEAPSEQVFEHSPHVDEVLTFPRKAGPLRRAMSMWRLRRRGFDCVVDFFGNPRSALLAKATGAGQRIGFDFPGRAWAYTDAVPMPEGRNYAAAHKAALLAPLGVEVPAEALYPQVYLGEAERDYAKQTLSELGVAEGDLVVALSPVSRQPYKRWPIERWARLADILIERYDAKVLFIFGPGEEGPVDQVRLEMHHLALPHYEPPPLLHMAALLERSHLYVGNDNGPRHFALAVGTPTVTVFGKTHPENWTPPAVALPDPSRHRTVSYDPGCKDACTYPDCDHLACINAIDYKAVEAEVEAVLEDVLRHGTPV